jgi:hypothetical protein
MNARRTKGIAGYESAIKDGKCLTMVEAAAKEFLPVVECVRNGLAHRAFRRIAIVVLVDPRAQSFHRRAALSFAQPRVRIGADDSLFHRSVLDTVDFEDEVESLLRFGRRLQRIEELAAHVRETGGALTTVDVYDGGVAGVRVDEQRALGSAEYVARRLAAAASRKLVGDKFVGAEGPHVSALLALLDGKRGLVGEHDVARGHTMKQAQSLERRAAKPSGRKPVPQHPSKQKNTDYGPKRVRAARAGPSTPSTWWSKRSSTW